MKKGINEEFAIPVELRADRDAEFKAVKEAGFDGIELFCTETFTDEQVAEIMAASKKYGVQVMSIVCGSLWTYQLSSNCECERNKAKELVKGMILNAKAFGADSVLVVPGAVSDTVSYVEAYNNAFQSLTELKPFIEEHKIYACVENVWNKFLITPFEMRDFIDKLDCEYIQSYFDDGNVLVNGWAQYWVEVLGKRIKKVHIKDFKRSVGNIEGFCDLLEGDMDWDKFMAALRAVGYDDYVTVEVPYYKHAPQKFLCDTATNLDTIFAM